MEVKCLGTRGQRTKLKLICCRSNSVRSTYQLMPVLVEQYQMRADSIHLFSHTNIADVTTDLHRKESLGSWHF